MRMIRVRKIFKGVDFLLRVCAVVVCLPLFAIMFYEMRRRV